MRIVAVILTGLFLWPMVAGSQTFVTFDSVQFRPLALSPDGTQLFALNTPDNTLEIFDVDPAGLTHAASVPVGLEPVAVAAHGNSEAWVVNHLSDSVSIVDLSGAAPRVKQTLLVGDEPRDIVFAGIGGNRAFISTAHRGQNSPYTNPTNPGELTTEGVGRTDVWVFDANNPGSALGGNPLTVLALFGDSAGALAASADGSVVYASVFKSGNQTTTLTEGLVCDGGASAIPCTSAPGEAVSPGGLPAPNADANSVVAPETGLIVGFDGAAWRDELGRDWSNQVRFSLPDNDVFAIDALATIPEQIAAYPHVGTVNFSMAVNPDTDRVYVANTDANNRVRFEGVRPNGNSISTVRGKLHLSRITVIDPDSETVSPRHLNKHINYADFSPPQSVKDKTLATPMGMAVSSNGEKLYVAAMGSGKVGVFDTAELENDSFVPDAADQVALSAKGPTGLVLDETNGFLFVLTRFNNSIAVIDTITMAEMESYALHNPEPASVVNGRSFLYDADYTSANGEASCGSCHVGADKDELAWDLGDPLGTVVNNPNPFVFGPFADPDFHSMKGPMTTQTFRGMAGHGAMHWRADRTAGNDAGGDPRDEETAFKKFNPAFVGLLGRASELTAGEMQAFADFALELTPPPNPIRALDDSLTAMQQAGSDVYFTLPAGANTCQACHRLRPDLGFYGTKGSSARTEEPQFFKVPQLRNIYEKAGMFGMPDTLRFNLADNGAKGDQIRGFGYFHDGSVDTVDRILHAPSQFNGFTAGQAGEDERDAVEQFVFAYDSNLKPVVGQQVTLTSASGTDVDGRVDLLVARAAAGDSDLVVKGNVNSEPRGWRRQNDGAFKGDKSAEQPLAEEDLRALAQSLENELTFTAVPVGSGERIGIDRDLDTVLDGDDNCRAQANLDQKDGDGDGIGNVCDANICHPD